MKFSKSLFIILGFVLITIASVRAPTASTTSTTSSGDKYYTGCYLMNVSLVSQDPYPATPDSYVTVVFQVSGIQNPDCGGAKFEFVPTYPFSLDTNDAVRTLNATTYAYGYNGVWVLPYKLRVDKDALDEESEIEIHYVPGNKALDTPIIKKFKIKVQDARTSFDAVIQESTGSQVSIAIANTGKYAANSVVVRIPEQEYFSVVGTDGQMVGNIDSGDYSMVSFEVSSKRAGMSAQNMTLPKNMPSQNTAPKNITRLRNMTRTQNTAPKELKFDIYYTDNIGERRVVNMALPFNYGNATNNFSGIRTSGIRATTTKTSSSLLPSSNPWVIVVLILIMAFIAYRVYNIKREGKKGTISHEIPDWVKNSEKKGKNK